MELSRMNLTNKISFDTWWLDYSATSHKNLGIGQNYYLEYSHISFQIQQAYTSDIKIIFKSLA
jgi:hypothetical protein